MAGKRKSKRTTRRARRTRRAGSVTLILKVGGASFGGGGRSYRSRKGKGKRKGKKGKTWVTSKSGRVYRRTKSGKFTQVASRIGGRAHRKALRG